MMFHREILQPGIPLSQESFLNDVSRCQFVQKKSPFVPCVEKSLVLRKVIDTFRDIAYKIAAIAPLQLRAGTAL